MQSKALTYCIQRDSRNFKDNSPSEVNEGVYVQKYGFGPGNVQLLPFGPARHGDKFIR